MTPRRQSVPRHLKPRVRLTLELLERRVVPAAVFPDFNGDSFDDLAIGVPFEDLTGVVNGGAVNVIYGSNNGLTTDGNEIWTQNIAGILDRGERNDQFGSALTWGDFNGDGFDDLAIGVPLEDISGVQDAGAVNVIYGSAQGLTATGNQFWHQNIGGLQDLAEANDQFGAALSAGDYDGDGFDDLAVGVPFEDIAGADNAGAVNVLYGTSNGLTSVGSQFWHQDAGSLLDQAETGDQFGAVLASGDFDGDTRDDLAVGVPQEDIRRQNAGAVNVIYGSSTGLTGAGNQFWFQGANGVRDVAEKNDQFGSALVAGDFNGDGRDDLAIGVPFEDINGIANAGAVNVLYGSATVGLSTSNTQFFSQGRIGLLDQPEAGDRFGWSLAAGDFDADGIDDLAVGVPFEDISGVVNAGAVNIIYGSNDRLTGFGSQFFHQNSPGVEDQNESNDQFAFALTAGDYDNDGVDDLAVGVPLEDIDGKGNVGAVIVIYGPFENILESEIWHQNVPGIAGALQRGDQFGFTLVRR